MVIYAIVIFIITYLICSFNPAIQICKLKTGEDIRKLGSGNAGTANAMRVLGKPLGVLVIILDVLKVIVSFFIAYLIAKTFKVNNIEDVLKSTVMLAAVIGHCYPIYYKFKGGKGVIVGMTTAYILDVKFAIVCTIIGLVILLVTRMVAMGTFCGTIAYVLITVFMSKQYIVPVLISCGIIMFKHRANIKRIVTRQEQKIW